MSALGLDDEEARDGSPPAQRTPRRRPVRVLVHVLASAGGLGSDKGPQAWPGLLARAGPVARHSSEPCVGRTGSRVFNPAVSARE